MNTDTATQSQLASDIAIDAKNLSSCGKCNAGGFVGCQCGTDSGGEDSDQQTGQGTGTPKPYSNVAILLTFSFINEANRLKNPYSLKRRVNIFLTVKDLFQAFIRQLQSQGLSVVNYKVKMVGNRLILSIPNGSHHDKFLESLYQNTHLLAPRPGVVKVNDKDLDEALENLNNKELEQDLKNRPSYRPKSPFALPRCLPPGA